VEATDANGGVSVRRGIFETDQRNVRVRFYEIHVSYDGDKGPNRGELTFWGGVNGQWRIKRSEGKVKSNSRVHFKNQGEVLVQDVGQILDLRVQGVERDRKGTCFDYIGSGPFTSLGDSTKKNCMRKTWNTAVGTLDLDADFAQDQSLPPGFGGAGTFNTTIVAGRGGVRFEVDVRVDVWTE
jgi:hypothetical protein